MRRTHTPIHATTRKANHATQFTQHGLLPLTQNKSCSALTQHDLPLTQNKSCGALTQHIHATNRVADLCPTEPTRDLPENR